MNLNTAISQYLFLIMKMTYIIQSLYQENEKKTKPQAIKRDKYGKPYIRPHANIHAPPPKSSRTHID